MGFRRGWLAPQTPAIEVALVVLRVVVAARLLVDKHPGAVLSPQPAPQRRPPATLSRLGKESTEWAAFPGRVGRAFAGRAALQAEPILVLLRAALQCHAAVRYASCMHQNVDRLLLQLLAMPDLGDQRLARHCPYRCSVHHVYIALAAVRVFTSELMWRSAGGA